MRCWMISSSNEILSAQMSDTCTLVTSFHFTIAFDAISTVFSTNVNHFGFQNFGLRRCFTFYHNKSL